MDEPILEKVSRHFSRYSRPADFINRDHCDECAEHYETLLGVPVDRLEYAHLGDGAWDPSAMLTPDGFRYYFPGIARIADQERDIWMDPLVMRLPLHYTGTFSPDDWRITLELLEHWWLDERLTQFERDGLERGMDTCRKRLFAES
jgi:hypothetical protein